MPQNLERSQLCGAYVDRLLPNVSTVNAASPKAEAKYAMDDVRQGVFDDGMICLQDGVKFEYHVSVGVGPNGGSEPYLAFVFFKIYKSFLPRI